MRPPAASATSANIASDCIAMASALVRFAGDLGGVERRAESLLVAEILRAFPEFRATDASRAMAPDEPAVLVLPHHLVDENVLRDDDVAFHAHHFGDVRDAA